MDNVTLRAMVRGMWKDAKTLASLGKPNQFVYSNWRDFACSYAYGFHNAERSGYMPHVWHIASIALINGAIEARRAGRFTEARKLLTNAHFANSMRKNPL